MFAACASPASDAGGVAASGEGAAFEPYVASYQELRDRRRFAGTVRQRASDLSCGASAVATLLTHHYERATSEADVYGKLLELTDLETVQQQGGFSMLDLKRYLIARGFDARGVRAPLDVLGSERIPAILRIQTQTALGTPLQHFVVLKGIRGDSVVIGDPALGTRGMSRADLEAMRSDDLLLLIVDARHLASAGFVDPELFGATPAAAIPRAIASEQTDLATFTMLLPGIQEF